jgi:hypothetical protein
VRREVTRRGGKRPCLRILSGMFAALADRSSSALMKVIRDWPRKVVFFFIS